MDLVCFNICFCIVIHVQQLLIPRFPNFFNEDHDNRMNTEKEKRFLIFVFWDQPPRGKKI